MRKRRKVIVKAPRKSRGATTNRTSDAAWKVAEREVARYFGTERAPIGQKGHDTREVPMIDGWLHTKDEAMRLTNFRPGGDDWFTHVFVESKCHLSLMPTLERWHNVVQNNPDKKNLRPLMVMGELTGELGKDSGLIGFCRLEDFPRIYRGFIAPPGTIPNDVWFANLLNRFWIVRQPLSVHSTILKALEQAKGNAIEWASKQPAPEGTKKITPLPLVYVKYPKRVTPALVFRIPS